MDGDCLSLTLGKATHGNLTRNWDGTYTYRPARGYTGAEGFAYTVSDGKLSASATISLTVVAGGGCWGGQSVLVAAGQQTYGGSSPSYGYIVVKRTGGDSDSVSSNAAAIDWDGSTDAAIGTSANVGGAWWNALVAVAARQRRRPGCAYWPDGAAAELRRADPAE